MAFPKLECHFNYIRYTPSTTECSVTFFSAADGGVVDGVQQYVRTVLTRRTFKYLDAGMDEQRIVGYFLNRLSVLNADLALGVDPADFICTLVLA